MAAADTDGGVLSVTVVYLAPGLTFEKQLLLPKASTVAVAVEASGVLLQVPELAHTPPQVGVFGQLRSPGDLLHDGDRVEIYRPLTIDPKEARRIRALLRRRRRPAAARRG